MLAATERAERRTEPDFVLLNAAEGCAYQVDETLRAPVRETVLTPGRADLALMRADTACHEAVAADPGRRAGVLAAVRHDHRPEDVPSLRALLRHGVRAGDPADLLSGAAAPLARYGDAADHALLLTLRGALPGLPSSAKDLVRWATDAFRAGAPAPEDEPPLFWARLARLQGQTELARVTLIRLLDDAGPRDDALVAGLVGEFEALGDAWQAERARRLLPRG
ncbi:hypothetical protein ACH4PU_14460 [Streptomyces sp. NPDC021100]|uniref:hypothetical protein n=1 Tax=Streptomyces sp. NPDC021100 TaxID=3365114 RepID=UPI00378F831F